MSNKSGNSSQVISLPKGGGAQRGIGESFSPDLHTGTGNFTVPLALPAGRSGFQPQLNLVYSTGNGNSAFGLGWHLSIPGISRKIAKGIPRYDDALDTFVLSGAEDLVPVEQHPTETHYQPRTEGLFARILHHRDARNDYWEVRSKDGLVSLYGTPGTSGRDPAAIADPADRSRVFAWRLTRTVDPFGNRIDYLYQRDAVQTEGPHHWDQLYLAEIRYVDYGDPANPQFLVTVKFSYENRTDPFSDYRAGFEIRTVRRCHQIDIFTQAETDTLTRTYHLVYLDQRDPLPSALPQNGVSLLSQVRVEGRDGAKSEWLPPLEFGYTRFEPERRDFFSVAGADLPPRSLAHPDYELADLFGNGLPDILELNGTARYWRNLGGGRFDLPRAMREAPAGLALADPGVQLLDANGDGRIDLLVTSNGLNGYFPLAFDGLWERRSFQRYRATPSFNLEDPEVRLVDLDGDGVTDALRSGTRFECFFNDPQQGWYGTRSIERRALAEFPNVNFSDPRVKWGDMSGDGLQDIVLVYDGNVEYWPNLGYGDWGKRIHMRNSPRFPYGYDPRRILLGDVDGDGLADIVYVDDTKVTVWINQSGNGWSEPIVIRGTPPVADMDAIRLTDLSGTGVSGVLWSTEAGGRSRQSLFFLDLTGGIKPYLLREMANHLGAVTRVEYAPSTRFYLADQQRPATRWQTPLPFPVQVVARVEVIDALSRGKLTTEYRYHHGYWDGAEREFRGFGRVDQRDTVIFEDYHAAGLHPDRPFEAVTDRWFSPPTETRTWFHQGPIGDEFGGWEEADFRTEFWPGDSPALARPPAMTDFLARLPRRVRRDALRSLRGSILRTELYALDGMERQDRPYSVTEHLYGVREESPAGASEETRLPIFFPHSLAQRTTQWERGDDPLTQLSFTDDYDDYGQPRSQLSVAVPRGRDFRVAAAPGEPYLCTQTVTTYAHRDDARCYLVGRVVRTTTQEILNDGAASVSALHEQVLGHPTARRLLGQTRHFYDGPACQGLPLGQLGDYGALVRTESLVLTEEILREAYQSGDAARNPPEVPPYLAIHSAPPWTAEYPEEFRRLLPDLAGYVFHDGGPDPLDARGYFVQTVRRRYDFQADPAGKGRGLVILERNPLGRDTTIDYDRFALLATEVRDAAGLTTRAAYDYRILQPREITDPNGNRSVMTFTPLGLPATTSLEGKAGEGDQQRPSTRLEYDLLAFIDHGQPISVRTIRQVHHDTETDVPQPERDETLETVEYSDGFGRLLQTRTQAEDVLFGDPVFGGAVLPAEQSLPVGDAVGRRRAAGDPPNVVVSGWQIYDNKGRVVEKYEPFFSTGWDYVPSTEAQRGRKVEMFYDPRGQVIRTVNPNGSEQRVIYGIPADLDNPDPFTPTPWEAYTYDANDNAGRTPTADFEAGRYRHHWNTPSSITIDALGRTVEAVARNRAPAAGPADPLPPIAAYRTQSTYDIRSNLLTITDALGRLAFRQVYDLANRPLRGDSIDAGCHRVVLDAMGNPIEQRDSKGALVLHVYDVLNRPLRLWARDGDGQAPTLRERLSYGDSPDSGLPPAQAVAANLLGKLYQHDDEAGRLTLASYDFKGNVLEKERRVIQDAQILGGFNAAAMDRGPAPAYRVDWQPPAGSSLEAHAAALLETTGYRASVSYDALNRVKVMHYPQDVAGAHKELRPHYNRAGALERVTLDGAPYVGHIAYDAKGQRVLIAYGNGVMTRYAYDPQTFRLVRLRTEPYSQPDPLRYHPTGTVLQDFAYDYDLAGNITRIRDRTPASGIPNSLLGADALDREFGYDPLYRLLSASGRECDRPPEWPWDDRPRGADLTRTRAYTEQYHYDPVGNIERLQHQNGDGGFAREFTLAPGSNRLATVTIGQTPSTYRYDPSGNLIQENASRFFEWDYANRLRVFRTQAGAAEPSVHAHYLYDAGGQRVKKLVRKQGGQLEVTVYIDGIFEHHRRVQGSATQENNSLHVLDNQSRIALVRVGDPFSDDSTPAVKYHLGDHLGSSHLVIGSSGGWTNREEYTPYGETSFGSFARKRYRFTGKEKDEESGLYYFGARYYSPSLGRWFNCDPAGIVDGLNIYQYVKSNPLNARDPIGLQSADNLDGGAPPQETLQALRMQGYEHLGGIPLK